MKFKISFLEELINNYFAETYLIGILIIIIKNYGITYGFKYWSLFLILFIYNIYVVLNFNLTII